MEKKEEVKEKKGEKVEKEKSVEKKEGVEKKEKEGSAEKEKKDDDVKKKKEDAENTEDEESEEDEDDENEEDEEGEDEDDNDEEDDDEDDDEDEDEEKEVKPKKKKKPAEERKKIFLIDDISFNLVKTKQILKEYYTIYTMESAAKMFELLEKVRPDLILLDINMPEMDGHQAIKILQGQEENKDIPVIFLSAKNDEDSIIKGLSLGAVDHVIKPYTPKTLLNCVAKYLNPVEAKYGLQVDTDKNASKQQVILAVDDSPSMLRSIHFALRNKYKVHTLQNPENLQKLIRGLKPDLFLLDYNMPVINGFQLVGIIREFKEFKDTPIIFLTSESSHEHVNEALNLGSSDYILKPFNPKKLRDKIIKCLEKKTGF